MKHRSVLFGASVFSLMAAWSILTPLFSGPDEPAHYIKSAAVIRGEWVGDNYPASAQVSYWTTYVHINPQFGTPNLIPWGFASFPDRPGIDIAIEDLPANDVPTWTNMGRYPLVPYLFSGLGTLFGPNDFSARIARLMTSMVCALLIAMAISAMKRRGVSCVGVLLALVPGVVFLASTMNPSAIEICAAITMWCVAPLVVSQQRNRWASRVFAISGLLLILTRPLGPALYIVIVVLSYCAVPQRLSLKNAVRDRWGILIVHATALCFAAWWYLVVYSFELTNKVTTGMPRIALWDQIEQAILHIPLLIDQAIGNFGWLDSPMPRVPLHIVYLAMLLVMARGLVSMSGREKLCVAALVCTTVLLVIAQDVNYYALLRMFGSQGRHIAPLLVGLPIVASAAFVWKRKMEIIVACVWGITMVWAGLSALRRYTVGINGNNAMDMLRDRAWNPVLGLWPTIIALCVSTIGVLRSLPYSRASSK